MLQQHFDCRVGHSCYTSTINIVTNLMATLANCEGVLNTLISNLDKRYKSKHPTYLLLGITKHLLMIVHKLSKVLITMRKDQQKQPYTVAAWRLVKKEDKLTVNGKDYHWCTSNHYSSIVKHNRMYADHKSNDHDIW